MTNEQRTSSQPATGKWDDPDTGDERPDVTRDPTKDKYLEGEKRVGAAEYALAADIAEDSQALHHAIESGAERAKASVDSLRKKARRHG